MARRGLRVTERSDVQDLVLRDTVVERLKVLDPDEYSLLDLLITQVSRDVARACRRELAYQSYEFTAEGDGGKQIYLPVAPVEPDSVTVTIDGTATTDFDLVPLAGGLLRGVGWTAGAEVVATFRAGYLLPGQVSTWTAQAQDYALGDWVRPTAASLSPLLFTATVSGAPGAMEPDWPNTAGDEVVDGGVTWQGREVEELDESLIGLVVVGVRERYEDLPAGIRSMRGEISSESYSDAATEFVYSRAWRRALEDWELDQ